tara:strand:+ start:934 stop:1428 length:495 start_codon:yes stop_codon:yes gene_type:complete
MMKVLFLHGMEGTPEGTKPAFLKKAGFRVIAPALPKNDFELSLARAKDTFENFKPDIVVGSSRGGALASALDTGDIPKILIAPAWKKFGVKNPLVNKETVILHCADDDLVPYEDSIELAKPKDGEYFGPTLTECGENHRMSDDEALQRLLWAIEARVGCVGENL